MADLHLTLVLNGVQPVSFPPPEAQKNLNISMWADNRSDIDRYIGQLEFQSQYGDTVFERNDALVQLDAIRFEEFKAENPFAAFFVPRGERGFETSAFENWLMAGASVYVGLSGFRCNGFAPSKLSPEYQAMKGQRGIPDNIMNMVLSRKQALQRLEGLERTVRWHSR